MKTLLSSITIYFDKLIYQFVIPVIIFLLFSASFAQAQQIPGNQDFEGISSANPISSSTVPIGSPALVFTALHTLPDGSDYMFLGNLSAITSGKFSSSKAIGFNINRDGNAAGSGLSSIGDYRIMYANQNDTTKKQGDFWLKSIYLAIGNGNSATITIQGCRAGKTIVTGTISLSSNAAISNSSATGLTYGATDNFSGTAITFGTDWQFLDGIRIATPTTATIVAVDDLVFGSPTPFAPSTQASALGSTNTTGITSTINWTKGSGDATAVFVTQANSGSAAPADNTNYTANTTYASGTQIGSTGWYCVYNGNGSSVNVTGLTPGTTYRAMAVTYNGSNLFQAFNIAVTNNVNNLTTVSIPATQASNIIATNVKTTTASLSWTNGNGNKRAVFMADNTATLHTAPVPVNNSTYNVNSAFGLGTQIGSSGWYGIYNNTGSSVNVTNLTAGHTYRVMVVEYADNGSNGQTYNINSATGNPLDIVTGIPQITDFSPASGPAGTAVTITGTNFNTTPANNIVFFGATMATVTAASATSLTVTAPAGATYQPISVLNNATNLIGYSAAPFVTTFTPNKGSITTNDFTPQFTLSTGNSPQNIAISDLDGDGKPDMVVVNKSSNNISVFRNISAGGPVTAASFAVPVTFAVGNSPVGVAIGDLDGDSKPDVVVTNFSSNTISVLHNITVSGAIDASSFAAQVIFAAGNGPRSVAMGDLDGDGKPDLAVANNGGNTVSVFRNTAVSGAISSSSFAAQVTFATGSSPAGVAIGDLDGDGKPDLAVVNNGNNNVSVFFNTAVSGAISPSSFAAQVTFATGSSPVSVVIGDLDGDGKPDLATANRNSNTVSVLRNTATNGAISSSSFAAQVTFATGDIPFGVAITDLDGDGKPDLTVTNFNSSAISILHNTASNGTIDVSSFAAQTTFATGNQPQSVAIGDLDGDGKPDLVVNSQTDNTISILRNNPQFPTPISSLTKTGSSPTNATSVQYTATFGAAITGLTASNFSISTTGSISGASVSGVSGSGTTYTVTVNAGTGEGGITLNLANATGLVPSISTTLPFAGDIYTIDKTAPTIAISNPSASSTITGPVTYTVTYADAHFNAATLAVADITLNATGTATGTIGVSGTGLTRTVTINNISGAGVLGISIAAGTASDLAANNAPAAGPATTFTVLKPVLSAAPSPVTFGNQFNNTRATQSFVLTGSDIIGTTTLTSNGSTAYTISKTNGSGYASSITFNPAEIAAGPTVYVQFAPTILGAASGNISISSTDASSLDVGLTGTAVVQAITTSGTLSALSSTYGTASASSTFNVSGSNMTAGILVAPPGGFEVSADNLTFSSTVIIGAAGTIPSTPVYIRLKSTADAASYSGDVVLSSSGAGNVNVATVASIVSPQNLIITAGNASKTYGTANPTLAVTYSGFVNGNSEADLTTLPTVSTTAVTGSPAGTYPITATGAASNNYSISYLPGTLTVNAAALTITANDANKIYGKANPTLSVSYSGFVNGDTGTSLTTPPTISTAAVTGSPAGTYPITATGAVSNNYNISYLPGTLTVNAAALTITANDANKIYGKANPTLSVSYSGFVNGDTDASLTTPPTISTAAGTGSPVGTYPITATGAESNNYNISYLPGTLRVNAAALTITADDANKIYGTANPTLSVSYSGFVNGDTEASLTTLPAVTTTADRTSPAGTYPIIANGATDANYTMSYVPGILTIKSSAKSSLAGITTTAGALSPAFAPGTSVYTVSVANPVTSVTLTPIATEAASTIKVNGIDVASGVASGPIALSAGLNIITVKVIAQDGISTSTYTITVVRAASNRASLASLSTDNGSLSPVFGTKVLNYTSPVDNTVNVLIITATATDPMATITVNGAPAPNGLPGGGIALDVGNNIITVVVTAQDGVTKQTYTLIIERGVAPEAITANNILTPNGDGKNDNWIVKDILLYPNNVVKIFDRLGRIIYNKQGYSNEWDGTFNGAPLSEGTYYYVIALGANRSLIKGFITILRNSR